MSLNISLKNNISPNNKLVKQFTGSSVSMECVLKEPVDINNPVFVVDSSELLSNYNYIDASDSLGRKYYITSVRSIGYNRWEISGRIDRLGTWANSILECTAIVNKQQGSNQTNKYLNDGSFVSQVNEFNTSYNFSGGFSDNPVYILICAGG